MVHELSPWVSLPHSRHLADCFWEHSEEEEERGSDLGLCNWDVAATAAEIPTPVKVFELLLWSLFFFFRKLSASLPAAVPLDLMADKLPPLICWMKWLRWFEEGGKKGKEIVFFFLSFFLWSRPATSFSLVYASNPSAGRLVRRLNRLTGKSIVLPQCYDKT